MQKRILALDWGKKRIGIAISDPLGISAQPLHFLPNDSKFIPQVSEIIGQYSVALIILGMPKTLGGQSGASAKEVENFALILKKHVNIPVEFFEEWFSTKQAERVLIDANTSRSKRKMVVDSMAAQIMLQAYLDSLPKR